MVLSRENDKLYYTHVSDRDNINDNICQVEITTKSILTIVSNIFQEWWRCWVFLHPKFITRTS